jgi:hypothetical protein
VRAQQFDIKRRSGQHRFPRSANLAAHSYVRSKLRNHLICARSGLRKLRSYAARLRTPLFFEELLRQTLRATNVRAKHASQRAQRARSGLIWLRT